MATVVGIGDARNSNLVVLAGLCHTNGEGEKGKKSGGLHDEGLVWLLMSSVSERKGRDPRKES